MQHGRHVKIVGKGDPDRLRSVDWVRAMLEEMVSRLGMRLLGDAHMYEVEEEIHKMGAEPFEDEGGVTGIAVLSTSHCAVHTWPLRSHFVMDVYSCRDFEAADVEQVLYERLGAYGLRLTDVSHSLEPLADADELPMQPVAQA
jgi:S-adenosylmethionine decarboxylase